MEKLKLWTALITPMQKNGQIDFEDLEVVVRKQEAAGNGILLLGSTGEGLALNDNEKLEVVQFVSGLNLNTAVMAGVGGFNLEKQKSWIMECNNYNIDAFLLVAPLYSKPGPVGLEMWFRTLLDTAGKACMIYNIPGRTGVKIPSTVLKNLWGHRNLWSLKEASGSVEELRKFRKDIPDLAVFSGDDGLLPAFADEGCCGLVSVAANVWPEPTSRYVELSLKGKCESFGSVWSEGAKALFSVSNPIPSKILLVEKGWIKNSMLRLPLTDKELTDRRPLLKADQDILNWYSNQNKR